MKQHVRQLAYFTAALGITVAAACGDDDEPSGPNVVQTNFVVTLNGANERPTPNTSTATGTATLTRFDSDSVRIRVQVAGINNVTASHIHRGDANTAGPIIVGLTANNPPVSFGALSQLHQSTINRTSTFSGTFTFDSLLTHLNAGTAYVNVHTTQFGGGEIRGQIVRQ